MAFALSSPRRARWRHAPTTGTARTEPRTLVRPLGISLAAATAVVVGAWGAVAGYVGPYFGYRPTSARTWDWTMSNGLLHLAPGALAVVVGLLMMAVGPVRREARPSSLGLPATLLAVAGAWFVIGPVAWPTFESSPAYLTGASATRDLLNQAGASLAPGLVLVLLAGMALKAAMARPVTAAIVDEPITLDRPASRTVGPADGAVRTGEEAPGEAPTAPVPARHMTD